jgi:hypothetical protein
VIVIESGDVQRQIYLIFRNSQSDFRIQIKVLELEKEISRSITEIEGSLR